MRTIVYLKMDEAMQKLQSVLNADEVVIESNEKPAGMDYALAILRVRRMFPKMAGQDKIPAIKKLREMVAGLGLAEAKAAVERPDDAINFYLANNRPMPLS